MFKTIKQFVQEALRELGRVTWPSRATVLRLTLGVVVVSVLFSLYAGLVDLGITTGLRELLVFKELRSNSGAPAGENQPIQVDPNGVQVETE